MSSVQEVQPRSRVQPGAQARSGPSLARVVPRFMTARPSLSSIRYCSTTCTGETKEGSNTSLGLGMQLRDGTELCLLPNISSLSLDIRTIEKSKLNTKILNN